MTRPVSLTVRVRIGDDPGPEVTVRGREAWALLALMAAGERGCTPIDTPGPRWSGSVHDLRKVGVVIETIRERHGGAFPGDHARYVLRSRITVLDTRGGGVKPLPATRKAPGEVSVSRHHTPASRTTTDGFAGHGGAFAHAGAGL
jgi:hypothetical protein